MNYRFISIYLIILTLNIASSKHAIASDNSEVCSFSQTNPGTLVTQGKPLATKLVTFSEAGGSPTRIDVTCKEPIKLTVSAPIQVAGPEFTPVSAFTSITTPSGSSTKSGDAPLNLPTGTTSLFIDLSVDKGNRLKAGNYGYTFKFTFIR